jgi:hypothetical protein
VTVLKFEIPDVRWRNEMWLARLFGKRKPKLMSAEVAAATLKVLAQAGIAEDSFIGIDRDHIRAINNVLFFTNAAIIINWLRLVQSQSNLQRPTEILTRFERLIFPQIPTQYGIELVDYINDLTSQITVVQEIASDKAASEQQFITRVTDWSRTFLSPVSDDIQVIEHLVWRCGVQLFGYVHEATSELANSVSQILYGNKAA